MSEEIKLDLKDRKILFELDTNARQTNSQIARKVGLNKNTVNYKINRMTKEGIIAGYYSVIDSSRVGYFSVRVYAKFLNTTEVEEKRILDWLGNNKQVGVVNKIETIYDFGFMAYVRSIYEWEEVWNEFKRKFRKYFWQEQVDIFSKVHHYKRKYLLGKKDKPSNFETIGGKETEKVDDTDLKILSLLARDARISLVDLSFKLKTPVRTLASRIKNLEKKKVIQGYRLGLNLNKIGYEYYKLNFKLNNCSNYRELFAFSENHINVIYIDQTLGDFDFEIDVEVKNRLELLELINHIKANFEVREVEILFFKEYLKLETIPRF
jgi:DNA-binding Lrp family transcriptional regulator